TARRAGASVTEPGENQMTSRRESRGLTVADHLSGAWLAHPHHVDQAAESTADLAREQLQQLTGERLPVDDQPDDDRLGQILRHREPQRRRSILFGVRTKNLDLRHQLLLTMRTMQPSGPQSGSGSPSGRTRRVAAREWITGAQFGIQTLHPAPSQPAV